MSWADPTTNTSPPRWKTLHSFLSYPCRTRALVLKNRPWSMVLVPRLRTTAEFCILTLPVLFWAHEEWLDKICCNMSPAKYRGCLGP